MTLLSDAGGGAQLGGMLLQAVGTYYGVRSQQLSMRSAAMNEEFQASMANLNARQAEREAQSILEAGQQRQSIEAMARGQEIASFRASQGASGVTGGGSGAEVLASLQLAKELDQRSLRLQTTAAANAARSQGVDFRNRADLARVSAGNIRRTSGTLSAWGSTLTSLLGSGSTLADSWTQQKRREG